MEGLLGKSAAWNCRHLRTEMSVAYLKWRYEEHVSINYRAVWAESHSQLVGCLIFRTATKHGFKGLIIEELIMSEPDPATVARLIDEAVRLSTASFLVACFSPGSFQRQTLDRSGFHRDMRKKINFVTRMLNPMPGLNPQRIQSWGLSMGDLEFL